MRSADATSQYFSDITDRVSDCNMLIEKLSFLPSTAENKCFFGIDLTEAFEKVNQRTPLSYLKT